MEKQKHKNNKSIYPHATELQKKIGFDEGLVLALPEHQDALPKTEGDF